MARKPAFCDEKPGFCANFLRTTALHVVALLPRTLLAHLRMVLGSAHTLDTAADPVELTTLLRAESTDLLIVDPAVRDGQFADAIEELVARHPALPVVVYTILAPMAMRLVVRLVRVGVQQVVLNRFDDEPKRFLDVIERVPAHPMAELMLEELASSLRTLPVVISRTIEQLFRSPARVKNSQDLARLAGMAPRTLYRHMTPAGLQPRHLIICARLLRAYSLLRAPGSRLKEITGKLGYSDPDTLSKLLYEWTGYAPKDIRREVPPELFVRLLADYLRRVEPEAIET